MSGHLFHESLYRYDEAQPSWWEATLPNETPIGKSLIGIRDHEIAVIGGGYTGISAALHLAAEFGQDVCVLEAGHIGWGASGRNGGFCTMGGTKLSASSHIKRYGLEETRRFFEYQREAVGLVDELISKYSIDVEKLSDGELIVAEKPEHFKAFEKECELQRQLGTDATVISKERFSEEFYDAPHQNGAMIERPGFGLHPLKYVRGLAAAAEFEGAMLYPNSEVVEWSQNPEGHVLMTASGVVRCKTVIVACNGFMPEKLHRGFSGRALPLQSQIIVTRELTDDELAAHSWKTAMPAINSRNVYHYYRMLPQNRMLFGGRADFDGSPEGASITADDLRNTMAQLFPEWANVNIDYAWRGFVCFTRELRLAIGRLPEDPSIYFGFGYHGSGVNNATKAGMELARWIAGGINHNDAKPVHLPAVVRGMPPAFPFPSLRKQYARLGVGWHRLLDRLDNIS